VTAVSTLTVTPDSQALVEFPSAHDHHSGVSLGGSGYKLDYSVQDRVCTFANDHRCMATFFPKGFGILVNESTLLYSGLYNDERDEGSPEIKWSMELALQLDMAAPKSGRKALLHLDLWKSEHFGTRNFYGTFVIPALTESVTWTLAAPTVSGTMINLVMHTHEGAGHAQTWLINAQPAALGLDTPPLLLPRCDPFVPASHGLTTNDTKRMIIEHANAAGASLRCVAISPSNIDYAALGDRQPVWRCYDGADRLLAGQNITIVTFFRAFFRFSVPRLQHVHVHAFFRPDPGFDSSEPHIFRTFDSYPSSDYQFREDCPGIRDPLRMKR